MQARCSHCGVPLPPGGICPYCPGRSTENAAPPPIQIAEISKRHLGEQPTRRPAPSLLSVVLPLGLVGAIGVGVFYFQSSGVFREWYGYNAGKGFCFSLVSDDNQPDLIGFSGSPSAQRHITAFDGKTGDILWSSEDYPQDSSLFCGDAQTVFLSTPGFGLSAVEAKSGKVRWQKTLSDQPDRVAAGDGCAAVRLRDQSVAGLSLQDGGSADCAAAAPLLEYSAWFNQEPVATLSVEGKTVRLAAKPRGTPTLQLEVLEGGSQLWAKDLPAQLQSLFSNQPLLAVLGDSVLVAGVDIADKDYLMIFGFSLQNGAPLFQKRESSHWSGQLQSFGAAGEFLYIAWGFGLHAYDPKTGERVWHIGGR